MSSECVGMQSKYLESYSENDVEIVARELHEAGRQAFLSGATVAQKHHEEKVFPFIEWDDLTEPAKEGKRIQARYLLNRFSIERGLRCAVDPGSAE